jgi:hypothetical protein
MTRNLVQIGLTILVGSLAIGCMGGTEAKATKEEENFFRNPTKIPPPEAGGPSGPPPQATQGAGSGGQ